MRLACFLPACVLLAGCSSTPLIRQNPVPATPDAAWVVNMIGNGASCPLASSSISLGEVDAMEIGQRVTDGEAVQPGGPTATVTCDVATLSVGGFQAQASASAGSDSLAVSLPKIDPLATMAAPSTGTVTYQSTATVQAFSGTCSFYFHPDTSEGVGIGKLWAAFTCPMLTGAGGQDSCAVSESFVVVENCGTMAGQ
jgi:hypothetical protein